MTLKKDDIHFLFFLFAIGTLSNSEAGGGVGGRRRGRRHAGDGSIVTAIAMIILER